MMAITARAKAVMTAAQASSKAVCVFVASEVIAVILLVAAVSTVAGNLAGALDLTDLPPWRGLAIFPALGIAIQAARALNAAEALRRWHGVAIRRIDERWGDER